MKKPTKPDAKLCNKGLGMMELGDEQVGVIYKMRDDLEEVLDFFRWLVKRCMRRS